MEKRVHPDLQKGFSSMPIKNYTQEALGEIRRELNERVLSVNASQPINEKLVTTEKFIPGPPGNPDVRIKLYEPKNPSEILPGVLFIHGGGFMFGSPEMNESSCQKLVEDINCVVVSVDYRLAPENPFPSPLEDCYATLKWFSENASELNIDSNRIAVVGMSAGGGLAAALSLLARDRKGPEIAFQMPLYPMLDDRISTPSSQEITDKRVWNLEANRQGWKMYLGDSAGEVSPYAAPTRASDLSGLPPTFTFVGDLDPFRDETLDYVARLSQAGVPVEFHLYPGCFHGFEQLIPKADISRRVINEYSSALKHALHKG
ncbi:alpha/beta hydrolase [Sporosarcina sp. CAU 1771]